MRAVVLPYIEKGMEGRLVSAAAMRKGTKVINHLRLVVGVSLVGGLVTATSAFAQTPAGRGYGGQGGNVQGEVGGDPGAAAGALPFTGMDLALMALAAVLLIATGLTMRRLGRARSVS